MFVNTIDPVLLALGPLQIRYYGLIYVLGFLFGGWWINKHRKELHLSTEDVYDFLFYLIIGVVVGARLFHVLFWDYAYFLIRPWEVFFVWQGGLAFHGGVVGAIAIIFWFARKHEMSWLKLGDYAALPAVIGLAFGRLANFTNHELFGPVTNVSWCVEFQSAPGCRHPYQIYSFLKRMGVFFLLLGLFARRKKFKDGFIFWNALFLMNVGRIIVDYWRVDQYYFGWVAGQWLALVFVVVSASFLYTKHQEDFKKLF